MANKGIVVKIKDSYCIILSDDGAYEKIPLSRVKNPRVGAETQFSRVNWVDRVRPLLLVASLLIFVLGVNTFRMAQEKVPEAYVSLDINPSVELGVDKNTKVIEVNALNEDAQKLVTGMDLDGKNLYAALRLIVNEAAYEGYIRPNQKNYILSTVTASSESKDLINYDNIALNLQESVSDKDLDVEFVIVAADMKLRNDAKNKGLSTGKMMVYQNSLESGEKLTVSQIKENSLSKLVNNHQIKLVPANNKAFVKALHVPPGQLKKGLSASGNKSSDKIIENKSPAENSSNKKQHQTRGQNGTAGDDLKDKNKTKGNSKQNNKEVNDKQFKPGNDISKAKKNSTVNENDWGKAKIHSNKPDKEITMDETDSTNKSNITQENTTTNDTGKEKKKAKPRT